MANAIPNLMQRLSKPSVTNEPPSTAEIWRNDLLMIGTLIFALFLGFGIRNRALNASQSVSLGENSPTITAPARWLTKQADSGMFQVRNPQSPSSFDAEIDIVIQPLEAGDDLEKARFNRSLQQSRDLQNYRELDVQQVEVRPQIDRRRGDAVLGVLTTYAYIADPSLDSGANDLPVVIEAQDLLFVYSDQLVVVSMAADANEWEAEQKSFALVRDSLNLQEIEQNGGAGGNAVGVITEGAGQ
jgi:hypothetical protein